MNDLPIKTTTFKVISVTSKQTIQCPQHTISKIQFCLPDAVLRQYILKNHSNNPDDFRVLVPGKFYTADVTVVEIAPDSKHKFTWDWTNIREADINDIQAPQRNH